MEMNGRHPGLVQHFGGALHQSSKGQTTMDVVGSLCDLQHSVLRMECDDDELPKCDWG